jgi:hypothetical protein
MLPSPAAPPKGDVPGAPTLGSYGAAVTVRS